MRSTLSNTAAVRATFLVTAAALVVAFVPALAVARTARGKAPTNTARPTIHGRAFRGRIVTASRGTWKHRPRSFAYRWKVCDRRGHRCRTAKPTSAQPPSRPKSADVHRPAAASLEWAARVRAQHCAEPLTDWAPMMSAILSALSSPPRTGGGPRACGPRRRRLSPALGNVLQPSSGLLATSTSSVIIASTSARASRAR